MYVLRRQCIVQHTGMCSGPDKERRYCPQLLLFNLPRPPYPTLPCTSSYCRFQTSETLAGTIFLKSLWRWLIVPIRIILQGYKKACSCLRWWREYSTPGVEVRRSLRLLLSSWRWWLWRQQVLEPGLLPRTQVKLTVLLFPVSCYERYTPKSSPAGWKLAPRTSTSLRWTWWRSTTAAARLSMWSSHWRTWIKKTPGALGQGWDRVFFAFVNSFKEKLQVFSHLGGEGGGDNAGGSGLLPFPAHGSLTKLLNQTFSDMSGPCFPKVSP